MKTNFLSNNIKKQVEADILCIENLLKDEPEYMNLTFQKIIMLNTEKVPYDFIRDHFMERYNLIKENMTTEIYNDFALFRNKVNSLVSFVTIDSDYIKEEIMEGFVPKPDFKSLTEDYEVFKKFVTQEICVLIKDHIIETINNDNEIALLGDSYIE